MAGTNKHGTLGAPMSRAEIIGGFLYLPLYLIGLSWLLPWLFRALGLDLSAVTLNLIYALLNLLVIILLFRRWLAAAFAGIPRRFWAFVQAVILGFVFYYALSWALSFVLSLIHRSIPSPNDDYIATLAGSSFRIIAIVSILLAPVVEETLFRGLIFSNLHQKTRIGAYAASALVFAAVHVWQYAGQLGWGATVLAAIGYLPAGVALGWTFEKSDTIWGPIGVHMLINAVSIGVLQPR